MDYRAKESLQTCPFNPAHQILPHRMATHIAKCWKNYPDADVKRCPFNACHIVKVPHFQAHIMECPDNCIVERDLYRRKKQELEEKKMDVPCAPAPSGGEDWDNDVVESGYNPDEQIVYREFMRKIPVGMGKAARKAWRAKEIERVTRLKAGEPIDDVVLGEELGIQNLSLGNSGYMDTLKKMERNGAAVKGDKDSTQPGKLRPPYVASVLSEIKAGKETDMKSIIKQKRILQKRLVGIKKLEDKMLEGQQLSSEERVKLGRKEETELELAELLEGVEL